MTNPSFIGRQFDQICFIVRDLDEAIDYWRRVNGVERWSKAYHLAHGQLVLADPHAAAGLVDVQGAASHQADLVHLPRHHRSV